MELSQKQSIIMEPEEAETGIARMKVTQVMCGFPSNKRWFLCGISTHLAINCTLAKGKLFLKKIKDPEPNC